KGRPAPGLLRALSPGRRGAAGAGPRAFGEAEVASRFGGVGPCRRSGGLARAGRGAPARCRGTGAAAPARRAAVLRKDELAALAFEAIGSLSGEALTRRHLQAHPPRPAPGGRIVVLALGKAAPSMARGAVEVLGPLPGLAVGVDVEAVPGLEVIAGD